MLKLSEYRSLSIADWDRDSYNENEMRTCIEEQCCAITLTFAEDYVRRWHVSPVSSILPVFTSMTFTTTKQYAHESCDSYVYIHVANILCINVLACEDIEYE